eukprot:CCRYP_001216-RA/>CCRYP_001216-RA protein AED:0.42 eAED:0.74 QI:66/0/0/1/0/0/2/96/43
MDASSAANTLSLMLSSMTSILAIPTPNRYQLRPLSNSTRSKTP